MCCYAEQARLSKTVLTVILKLVLTSIILSKSDLGSGSGSSNTSFLIDEVIVEEDEEALEAENLEVISSTPVFPVKSILKRHSQTSLSCSSDDSGNNICQPLLLGF